MWVYHAFFKISFGGLIGSFYRGLDREPRNRQYGYNITMWVCTGLYLSYFVNIWNYFFIFFLCIFALRSYWYYVGLFVMDKVFYSLYRKPSVHQFRCFKTCYCTLCIYRINKGMHPSYFLFCSFLFIYFYYTELFLGYVTHKVRDILGLLYRVETGIWSGCRVGRARAAVLL